MLQRTREWLVLALIAALPFHALFVTAGTRLIEGPAHAPLGLLAAWKEGVVGVLFFIASFECISRVAGRRRMDLIDALVLALIALSLAVTATTHGDWKLYAFGFKYDFFPLVAFLILRRVPWSEVFQRRACVVLLSIGAVVAGYGILTFFLPSAFFTALGYSDLHSLYLPDAPIAAFQQIGGTAIRRIQSTFSGPNQFGLWLLLPWSFAAVALVQRKVTGYWLLVTGLALVLTFSRSAWIAAVAILMAALWQRLPRPLFQKACLGFLGGAALLAVALAIVAPNILWRFASTREHLARPLRAMETMAQHPFGLGLGMAGPASNRVSDACVFLEEGSDAFWAADRPALCVFIGERQVQPVDRACRCPFLPENWYLQMGVELGVAGLLLYVMLIVLMLRRLQISDFRFQIPMLAFLGVSIAALFLHAWEDSAVAYTLWILAAAAFSRMRA